MIVINLTINIVLPDDQAQRRPVHIADIVQAAMTPSPERRASLHQVDCQICRKWSQWYETPEKARQGLAGHQSWCKRNVTKKRHGKQEY